MIWPVDLAVFYPHSGDQLPVLEIGVAIVMLAIVSAERSRCGAGLRI